MSNQANQLRFPEVVATEASAGSGKTFALATRYLQLLMHPATSPDSPRTLRAILAITFTNKATVEMKERIIEFLKRIAFDTWKSRLQEEEILSSLGLSREAARSAARRIMDELIRHYSFFQVRTIDSFINSLLLGCSLIIDRSAHFKIKGDYSDYLAYCLDCAIEEAREDVRVHAFFLEFLEHYLFVENRTGWFPKEEILKFIRSLFQLTNKYGQSFSCAPGSGSDVIKKKRQLFAQIGKLAQHIGEGLNGARANSIRNFLERNDSAFLIDRIPNVFIYEYPPMNKGKNPSGEFLGLWQAVHRGVQELVELDATVFYNPYIMLLERIAYFFQDISKKDDVLFLEELNHKARALFDEGGITVAEIYYRLATRFYHYLVDEFQDTSTLQWQNLCPMIEEALSCGGSLFYVGDTKQAIYRFRGGEAELFGQVSQELSRFNVRKDNLSKNWRSQRAIVEFNNKVFSRENLARAIALDEITDKFSSVSEECNHILDVFSDAHQSWRQDHEAGYVYVERLAEEDTQERESLMREKILKLLGELTERFSYQDIAILARGNDEVELVTSWLLEANIPVESDKTLNVLENSLIKEVIAFLHFLHSPLDDLSFTAFILGDIASRSSGLGREVITDFIFTLRKEKKLGQSPLYRYFRERWPRAWKDFIEEFFRSVGFLSHYELTVALYQRYAVYENFPDSQAFFMKFLELIKVTEEDHVDLGDFLSYLVSAQLDELYVSVAGASAVRVITIHKAKGLEFDVVIVPFLRMEIDPETAGKGTSSYVSPEDFRLVRITEKHRYFSPQLKNIYSYNYRKACIDEFNAIYVALTRPRYELYVFVPALANGNEKNKARFLIPEDITEIGTKRAYPRSVRTKQTSVAISPSHYKDWAVAIRDEFGDVASIRNRKNILAGDIIHAILSRIGNCQEHDTEKLIAGALEYTQRQFPGEGVDGYQEKIYALIQAPALRDFFFVDTGKVFCEKDFVDAAGNMRRIDRLLVRADGVVVVDFKTSCERTEDAQTQMRHYMRMMRDIYPGRAVSGYLVYVESREAIEVHLSS